MAVLGVASTVSKAHAVHANMGTPIIDGSATEWPSINQLDPDPLYLLAGAGQMGLSMHFAWDLEYFYMLIRETGDAPLAKEAPAADYTTLSPTGGPLNYDGVAFWMDL